MEPLDPQDMDLVVALQAEPRARAVRLGEVLGLSAPTVSTRLNALRERGAIEVIGILDYRALATSCLVIALVRGVTADFIAGLADRRGVVFAVHTVGAWDGAVCLIADDSARMENQVEWLREHTSAVEVNPVLDIAVTGMQRQVPVAIRDGLDADLACLLAVDARASFTAMAEALGIPEATARSRAQRLLEGHVVTPLVIPHPALFGLDAAAGLGVQAEGPVRPILDALSTLPGVITTAHLQGRLAAVIEVLAPDMSAIAEVRDQVRGIPGVAEVEVLGYGRRVVGRWPLPPRS